MKFKTVLIAGFCLFFMSCGQMCCANNVLSISLPLLKLAGSFLFITGFIISIAGVFGAFSSKDSGNKKGKEGSAKENGLSHSLFTMLLFAGLSWWTAHSYFTDEYGDLEENAVSYVILCDRISETQPDSSSSLYLSGKVMLIDKVDTVNQSKSLYFESAPTGFTHHYTVKDRSISILQEELPDELQARELSEVETIIVLKWSKKVAYNYTRRMHSYQINCNAAIYDKRAQKLIGTKSFEGDYPPAFSTIACSLNGEPPNEKILTYISSLRRIN